MAANSGKNCRQKRRGNPLYDASALRREIEKWTEVEAMRRSFGTKPPKPLKPAVQDELFNPIPQGRLF